MANRRHKSDPPTNARAPFATARAGARPPSRQPPRRVDRRGNLSPTTSGQALRAPGTATPRESPPPRDRTRTRCGGGTEAVAPAAQASRTVRCEPHPRQPLPVHLEGLEAAPFVHVSERTDLQGNVRQRALNAGTRGPSPLRPVSVVPGSNAPTTPSTPRRVRPCLSERYEPNTTAHPRRRPERHLAGWPPAARSRRPLRTGATAGSPATLGRFLLPDRVGGPLNITSPRRSIVDRRISLILAADFAFAHRTVCRRETASTWPRSGILGRPGPHGFIEFGRRQCGPAHPPDTPGRTDDRSCSPRLAASPMLFCAHSADLPWADRRTHR